jgi:hypothetical protein
LVEVYKTNAGDTAASEGGGSVGTDTAESDDDYEGGAKFLQPSGGEEEVVAGELFEY